MTGSGLRDEARWAEVAPDLLVPGGDNVEVPWPWHERIDAEEGFLDTSIVDQLVPLLERSIAAARSGGGQTIEPGSWPPRSTTHGSYLTGTDDLIAAVATLGLENVRVTADDRW